MQRRNFIKNLACIGCIGLISSGCKNISFKDDKFYYKSKAYLPKKVHLEACSLCQLDCPECYIRKTEKNMPKDWLGYLKFKDFKKFVDENDIKEIELASKGEIFLNPELDDIIKYAYQKNIKLTANVGTNLNTVSDITLENLVKYKFYSFVVSIDGATPETYKIYRVGGDFNKVIDNIKKINNFKEKYKSEYPKLTWQFIPFGHNEHEIELAKKKAKELNMKIVFLQNHSFDYSPVKNKELVEKQTGLKLEGNEEGIISRQYTFSCNALFESPQIDYDGKLSCYSRGAKYFSANVFKDGFLNALNSPDFIYAKKMLTDLSIEARPEIMCTKCKRFKYLRNNNITISLL